MRRSEFPVRPNRNSKRTKRIYPIASIENTNMYYVSISYNLFPEFERVVILLRERKGKSIYVAMFFNWMNESPDNALQDAWSFELRQHVDGARYSSDDGAARDRFPGYLSRRFFELT